MGGFLAIYFSKLLNASSVLAFAPQWSVDHNVVPSEKRWSQYTKKIEKFKISDLRNSFDRDIRYLVIFGKNEEDDLHRSFFEEVEECDLHIFHEDTHLIAKVLKQQNKLYPIINSWLSQ